MKVGYQIVMSSMVIGRSFAVSVLWVLCGFVVNLTAQEFKTVKDGVEYAEITREASGKQVKINLLRLDLTKVRLDVVHAMDAAIGTEKTSSMATRLGALAAINAGFFKLDTSAYLGDPAGALQIDNRILSDYNGDRIALGIRNDPHETVVGIAHLAALTYYYDLGNTAYKVSGINRELKNDEVVRFTPEFGTASCGSVKCVHIVVKRNRIIRITTRKNVKIPAGGCVYSASGKERSFLSRYVRVGRRLPGLSLISFSKAGTIDFPRPHQEDIVGGRPQLIKNGKIDITWEQEKITRSFVETRHPRTAVAKLRDGKFLMITVDGRSEQSAGTDLYDLAAYLLELGATDAMNLDGGGSTTMFLDGKVVNHPSDKEGERKVSDAILVTPRKIR